jgi:hypothetical protein
MMSQVPHSSATHVLVHNTNANAGGTRPLPIKKLKKFIGKTIEKEFDGEFFKGKVISETDGLYHVVYEDNDEEDLDEQELKLLVIKSDQRAERTAENLNNEATEQFEFVKQEELECVVRLSRRLVGGASTGNLRTMCAALCLPVEGNKVKLQSRLEVHLRKLNFHAHPFVPTLADIKLPIDEFNAKFEHADVLYMRNVVAVLRTL